MTPALATLGALGFMYLGYRLGMWNAREAAREEHVRWVRQHTTEG